MSEPTHHILNDDCLSPIILLAEHAGRAFPKGDTLGLDAALFEAERNLPFDVGVDGITRALAEKLGATAILGHYSRLWVDLNRTPDAIDLIPLSAHGFPIPGNQQVDAAAREARLQHTYWPFHREVETQIQRHLAAGIKPVLFSVHSFTPRVGLQQSADPTAKAPELGLLYLEETDMVQSLRQAMQARGVLTADNFPYDLRQVSTGGLHMHGLPHQLPLLGVEISIDTLLSPTDERAWMDHLLQSLLA